MSLVNVTFFVYVVKVLASGSTTDSSTIQATLALVNYKKKDLRHPSKCGSHNSVMSFVIPRALLYRSSLNISRSHCTLKKNTGINNNRNTESE